MHGKVFKRFKNPERFGDMLKERMLKSFNSLPQVKFVKHCMKSVQIRSFSWSIFSCIWTEYGDLRSSSPYSVRIREDTDQKKLRIWTLFTQCKTTEKISKAEEIFVNFKLVQELFQDFKRNL